MMIIKNKYGVFKKLTLVFFFASFFFYPNAHATKGLLEAKFGYFRPTSKTFRDIYSEGTIYAIEGNIKVCKQFYTWSSVAYFSKSGSTIGGDDPTKIHLIPIGLGLKYFFTLNQRKDRFYIGGGVLPAYLHVRNQDSFFIPKTVAWTVGGIAKIGFIRNLRHGFFFDFFADYMFLQKNFSDTRDRVLSRNKAKLSGFSIGAGLGYCF